MEVTRPERLRKRRKRKDNVNARVSNKPSGDIRYLDNA
jgi:hypothetical protein